MSPRLTQVFNAVLKSGRMGHFTMFGILIAFIIWFNYGTVLDRAISGTPPTQSLVVSARDDSPMPDALGTNKVEFEREPVVSDVPVSTAPATPSIEDQMQKIDRDAKISRIEKLARDTLQLGAESNAWNRTMADLATSDSGRRMASDPEVFRAVTILIESEPVPADDLAVLKSRVRVLEDEALTLRGARSSNSLDGAVAETKAMFERLRHSLDVASLSLAGFEKRSQLLKPSPMTLADAIVADEEKRAAELSSQLVKEKLEDLKKIADEKREVAAMLNKVALEREREDAAAEQAKMQAGIEAARIKAVNAAEKQQLESEFARDLPQIQHYLGKFFAKGYTQPQSATHYQQTSSSTPVSLAAIQKAGALSDVVEGLDGAYPRFLHLMASPTNDRVVQSPYPRFIGGHVPPESAATVRQGYTLLKKYQYLLVEKGYLAP